jgi:uncharacterized membrane protein
MPAFIQILTILMGLLMIVAGITHFLRTRLYLRIVPEFFPLRTLIVQVSGLIELAAGIGLFIPAARQIAALVVWILMIAFLPLHIWDVTRARPAMGSRGKAWIRLVLQFVLIAWTWALMAYWSGMLDVTITNLFPDPL